jgi:hypothetical protein
VGLEVEVISKAFLFSGNVQQAIGNCNSVNYFTVALLLHAPDWGSFTADTGLTMG